MQVLSSSFSRCRKKKQICLKPPSFSLTILSASQQSRQHNSLVLFSKPCYYILQPCHYHSLIHNRSLRYITRRVFVAVIFNVNETSRSFLTENFFNLLQHVFQSNISFINIYVWTTKTFKVTLIGYLRIESKLVLINNENA